MGRMRRCEVTSPVGIPVRTIDPLGVDVYAGDLNGKPDWSKLVAAGPPWHFAMIKATEGLHYSPPWFRDNWPAIRAVAGERYGVDFFRGCYHYLRFELGGAAQAAFFCDAIDAAGGWGPGDLFPVVDVERAGNVNCTKQDVVRCVTDFVAELKQRTGREVILYAGSLLADLGITDHFGCSYLWIARYTPTLPKDKIERIGWDLSQVFAWQYCGDGESYLEGYPCSSPIGKTDISAVLVDGGGASALRWISERVG